ncbi:hypothetical protein GE21DRAFT_1204869, partial [Neurospora crassa]
LEINADYFASKKVIFNIIVGRLGGKAREAILPFIYEYNSSPPRLTTIEGLLNYLKESYLNKNIKEKINIEFEKLTIKENKRFQDFEIKFIRLIG